MNKFILVLVSVFMFSLSSVSSTFADEEIMVTTTSVEMVSVTEVSVEEDKVVELEESATKAQDYNSSRSNKARWESNVEDKTPNLVRERVMELKDLQVRWQAKKEHVLEAVEIRKQQLRELQVERKKEIEARVKNVSVQKRNQFVWARKIIEKHVSAVKNEKWLKSTLERVEKSLVDLEKMKDGQNKELAISTVLELKTSLENRLQEIYESTENLDLQEVLSDIK